MKRIFLIVLCVACMQFVCAQEVLTLPYEANGLTEEQKAMNPDRFAYPTEPNAATPKSMPPIPVG